jgi:hypothetical protein
LNVRDIDPGLGVPPESIDLIIGEVKEGRVGINSGVRDPDVLRAVIGRFGDMADTDDVIKNLLDRGSADIPPAYTARVIAFGSFPPGAPVPPCRIISLGHVYGFLQRYVRKNWDMLRHMQFKDPAFGFLMTLEKARRGEAGRRGDDGVELVGPMGEERIARSRSENGVVPPPPTPRIDPQSAPMAQQRPLSPRPLNVVARPKNRGR